MPPKERQIHTLLVVVVVVGSKNPISRVVAPAATMIFVIGQSAVSKYVDKNPPIDNKTFGRMSPEINIYINFSRHFELYL